MKAAAALPDDYIPFRVVSVHDRRLFVAMNLLGLALLFLFGWLFLRLTQVIRPSFFTAETIFPSERPGWLPLLLPLAAVFLVMVLHELVHGFFFWTFTRSRPRFGLNPLYAYAAAPGWYIPRNQFFIVGLSPLVIITLLGLLLLLAVPLWLVLSVYLALTVNAAGSVGDIMITVWLLRKPTAILAQDTGPAVFFYQPAKPLVAGLYRRWEPLLRQAGNRQPAWPLFNELVQAYSAPHRHYHNLEHLRQVLTVIDHLVDPAADNVTIELAAWFHDAVYNPRSQDNEAQSAAYARDALRRLQLPAATIDQIARFVQATADHRLPAGQPGLAALLDADLAILGASPEVYARYAQAIRREYEWVEERQYRAARRQLLADFLARKRIYHTPKIYHAAETQARQNVAWEIQTLSVANA